MGANGGYWKMMTLAPSGITEHYQYPLFSDDQQYCTILFNSAVTCHVASKIAKM